MSRRAYATRDNLVQLTGSGSGGTLTKLLEELSSGGFVEMYAPLQRPVGAILHRYAVADDVNRKWVRAVSFFPALSKKTRQNVLISVAGATPRLKESGVFSHIITLEDLFTKAHWA